MEVRDERREALAKLQQSVLSDLKPPELAELVAALIDVIDDLAAEVETLKRRNGKS